MLKDSFPQHILNDCFKFNKLHGEHVLNYAKRFIVLEEVVDDVKSILRKELRENCPEVISISTFEERIPQNRTICS